MDESRHDVEKNPISPAAPSSAIPAVTEGSPSSPSPAPIKTSSAAAPVSPAASPTETAPVARTRPLSSAPRPATDVPSFTAILRVLIFSVVAGGVVFLSARRWAAAYDRFHVYASVDVTSQLAAEPVALPPAAPDPAPIVEPVDESPRPVTFRLTAPEASVVLLGGSFNGFDARTTPMTRGEDGTWEAVVTLAPGRYLYKFKVDGQWTLDPSNPEKTASPREASVLEL